MSEEKYNNRNEECPQKTHQCMGYRLGLGRNSEPAGCSILIPQVEFSSVAQLCPTLCDPMDCSKPRFPVHHQLPELT